MFSVWSDAEASATGQSETVFWWLVRLRWLAVCGVALVLTITGAILHQLPPGATIRLWAVAAILATYNGVLAFFGPQRGPAWLTSFGVQIAADCLALACLVHFAGGVDNPFLPLFVLHVVNANIVLSGRGAQWVLALALALVVGIPLAEGLELLPHYCLHPTAASCPGQELGLPLLATLGGLVLTLVACSLFTRFLTEGLRQGRRRLLATVNELHVEKDRLNQARSEIDTERGRLQAIIDCMGDAVMCWDPSGRVLVSNQRARELEHAGSFTSDPELTEALRRTIADEQFASGMRSTFEIGDRTFEATHSPVRGPQGGLLGLVTVARDISDRLAMEKHLMYQEQMSVVGKLAASVAHEINNPIGVIFLYSQHALAKLPAGSPVHDHLETIRRNADACRKIVVGLLDLARRHKPERRPVELHLLCREIVDSVRPLAAGAGAVVSMGERGGTSDIWAYADAAMLRQALLNLAVNAVEAVGPGGEIAIGCYETLERGTTTHVIEVRDNGPGIPPELVGQIFQPFFTTKASGTGLGLSIADNVVKSHNGHIEVDSVQERGTLLRIVLPCMASSDVLPPPVILPKAEDRERRP